MRRKDHEAYGSPTSIGNDGNQCNTSPGTGRFHQSRSTVDSIIHLVTSLEEVRNTQSIAYVVLLDIHRAFGVFTYDVILRHSKVSGRMLLCLLRFQSESTSRINSRGTISSPRKVSQWVLQGEDKRNLPGQIIVRGGSSHLQMLNSKTLNVLNTSLYLRAKLHPIRGKQGYPALTAGNSYVKPSHKTT